MALNYNPRDAESAWDEGEYHAKLAAVEQKTSKGGNDMEVWTIDVFGNDGRDQQIKEYVVIPAATFKIKQLASALGKRAEFDAGAFQAEDNIGATFLVDLKIEKQDGYDDKNRVAKFKSAPKNVGPVVPRVQRTSERQPVNPIGDSKEFDGTDIPFSSARSR